MYLNLCLSSSTGQTFCLPQKLLPTGEDNGNTAVVFMLFLLKIHKVLVFLHLTQSCKYEWIVLLFVIILSFYYTLFVFLFVFLPTSTDSSYVYIKINCKKSPWRSNIVVSSFMVLFLCFFYSRDFISSLFPITTLLYCWYILWNNIYIVQTSVCSFYPYYDIPMSILLFLYLASRTTIVIFFSKFPWLLCIWCITYSPLFTFLVFFFILWSSVGTIYFCKYIFYCLDFFFFPFVFNIAWNLKIISRIYLG